MTAVQTESSCEERGKRGSHVGVFHRRGELAVVASEGDAFDAAVADV
jgi:hypothetical protein